MMKTSEKNNVYKMHKKYFDAFFSFVPHFPATSKAIIVQQVTRQSYCPKHPSIHRGTTKDHSNIQEPVINDDCNTNLTFSVVVSVAMFNALLRIGVAAGAKATAEPTRREAIASFMLSKAVRDFECRSVG